MVPDGGFGVSWVSWVVWAGAGDLVVGMLADMVDWVSDTGF